MCEGGRGLVFGSLGRSAADRTRPGRLCWLGKAIVLGRTCQFGKGIVGDTVYLVWVVPGCGPRCGLWCCRRAPRPLEAGTVIY